MFTNFWIIGMWVVVIGSMYLFANITFWIFAKVFGIVDNYLQNRYWRKHGYRYLKDYNGKEWYVSETHWP